MDLVLGSGEAGVALLVFAVAVIVAFFIDDDDLPGPRLCRISAAARAH